MTSEDCSQVSYSNRYIKLNHRNGVSVSNFDYVTRLSKLEKWVVDKYSYKWWTKPFTMWYLINNIRLHVLEKTFRLTFFPHNRFLFKNRCELNGLQLKCRTEFRRIRHLIDESTVWKFLAQSSCNTSISCMRSCKISRHRHHGQWKSIIVWELSDIESFWMKHVSFCRGTHLRPSRFLRFSIIVVSSSWSV